MPTCALYRGEDRGPAHNRRRPLILTRVATFAFASQHAPLPVFDGQRRDSSEFIAVGRDERQAVCAGDCCDHQIIGPMGVPCRSRSARSSLYCSAASSSNAKHTKGSKNAAKRSRFASTWALFRAPYNSSAFTMLHRASSSGATKDSRAEMLGERPVRCPMQVFVSSKNRIRGLRDLQTHPGQGGQNLDHRCYPLSPPAILPATAEASLHPAPLSPARRRRRQTCGEKPTQGHRSEPFRLHRSGWFSARFSCLNGSLPQVWGRASRPL
jgi:hypothetical protein